MTQTEATTGMTRRTVEPQLQALQVGKSGIEVEVEVEDQTRVRIPTARPCIPLVEGRARVVW